LFSWQFLSPKADKNRKEVPMVRRIVALVFIYICTSVAWAFLGSTVEFRTRSQDAKLRGAVGQLWGVAQRQKAPRATYWTERTSKVETVRGAETQTETKTEKVSHSVPLAGSDVKVALNLEPRRKGLLWYATYRVAFEGRYVVANPTDASRDIRVDFEFPCKGAVYEEFRLLVGGEPARSHTSDGGVHCLVSLEPGASQTVEVAYRSQGLDAWWYDFGEEVEQVRDFSMTLTTDFDSIDFPQNSISPTTKSREGKGWKLRWNYTNLLSGVQIGLAMPKMLNPGPWLSRITFTAPVSLFLFFFLVFVIQTREGVRLHPMNYFFLAAAFFAFHLLLAYMVDHLTIHLAFAIASAVSIALVVSYVRIVASARFALLKVGLAQFVYLVLFSYTFFFEEYTGLAVTVLCVLTLFAVMQYTARMDWEEVFRGKNRGTA
jgi:hypothetical protein